MTPTEVEKRLEEIEKLNNEWLVLPNKDHIQFLITELRAALKRESKMRAALQLVCDHGDCRSIGDFDKAVRFDFCVKNARKALKECEGAK